MLEGIVSILGLCITFIPVIMFVNYLLNHVNKMTRFDLHKNTVVEKKGQFGVCLAYAERTLFGILVSLIGIYLSDFFRNSGIFKTLVLCIILYVIVRYFDEKNEK